MPGKTDRTYTRVTRHAVSLLGREIRSARKERKMTVKELAERAGISRGLLQRIERGNLNCGIGVVFEAATLVGIKLFDVDEPDLIARLRQVDEKLALLPKHIHPGKKDVDDDF